MWGHSSLFLCLCGGDERLRRASVINCSTAAAERSDEAAGADADKEIPSTDLWEDIKWNRFQRYPSASARIYCCSCCCSYIDYPVSCLNRKVVVAFFSTSNADIHLSLNQNWFMCHKSRANQRRLFFLIYRLRTKQH